MRGQRLLNYLLTRRYSYERLQSLLLFAGVVVDKTRILEAEDTLLSSALTHHVAELYTKPRYQTLLIQEKPVMPLSYTDISRKQVDLETFFNFLRAADVYGIWPTPDSHDSGKEHIVTSIHAVVNDSTVRDAVELLFAKGVTPHQAHTILCNMMDVRLVPSASSLEDYSYFVVCDENVTFNDRVQLLEEEQASLRMIAEMAYSAPSDTAIHVRRAAAERRTVVERLLREIRNLRDMVTQGLAFNSLDLLETQLTTLMSAMFTDLISQTSKDPESIQAYAKIADSLRAVVKDKSAIALATPKPASVGDEEEGESLEDQVLKQLRHVPVDDIVSLAEAKETLTGASIIVTPYGVTGAEKVSDNGAELCSKEGANDVVD